MIFGAKSSKKKQTYALNLLVNFSLKLYNDYSKFLNNKSAKIVESEILLTKQRFAKNAIDIA